MIYPTSTSPDLRRPNVDGRAGSQNERWDDIRLNRVAAAEAAMPPSNVADPLHHTAVAVAEAASPLDNFLSGEHQHKYPFGFTLSITSSTEHEHKLSLPSATPSEYEQTSGEENEDGSCEESASIVSELTQMTYRAEIMKQAITIEFEKFRQQKKHQGVEEHPEAIKTMFHRTLSCPDIQKSMTSFVNITSAKMKTEERQRHLLGDVQEEEEYDATSDPTIQRRVDELFVEFGVRPARPIPHAYEISEENAVRSRPSNEQGAATDHHLDSVIQLKLQLAQKQATLDELSHKYNALLVQQSAHQHDTVVENSRLRQENECLRAQLRKAGITTTSAAATCHPLNSLSCDLADADSQDHLTPAPASPSQPSQSFNIHKVLQDRLAFARVVVDTEKFDAINASQTPPNLQDFKSFGTTSTAIASSATNESHPLQPSSSLNRLNSFSNLIQGWRNRPTTTTESSEVFLNKSLTMRTVGSIKSSDTSSRQQRGNGKEWTSALTLQRPSAA